MLTLRVDAERQADAYAAVLADLAGPAVPEGVDVNELPKAAQRDLIRAEMARRKSGQR